MSSPNILVAGASGYIGRSLIPALLERFPFAKITALSRSKQNSEDPRVEWKPCDLFSLKSMEEALPEQVDLAFYLVHSMGPTAHLDQGHFADYDLILADNFARAVKTKSVQQVIYLGGLLPSHGEALSPHLRSRREVEQCFVAHGLPLTVFRAGLIMGLEGSSFQMLLKLVKRLPVMLCPSWTRHRTHPVGLEQVIRSLAEVANDPEHVNKTYDLQGCKAITYLEMMKQTAAHLGLKRRFVIVPFLSPHLSRLWVSLITNTPRNLVYPLVASLRHEMLARPEHKFSDEGEKREFSDLIATIPMETKPGQALFHFQAQRKSVRSVQRLPLPYGTDALWVKDQYIQWLPRHFFGTVVRARIEKGMVVFESALGGLRLLELRFNEGRSNSDRQLLHIESGMLVAQKSRGRLEFRVVEGRHCVLAAIHDFKPALPWFIYVWSQAVIHLSVMRSFGRYLKSRHRQILRKSREPKPSRTRALFQLNR